MARFGIFSRVDTNEIQAEFDAGLHDADGDFAPVGYQNFMLAVSHQIFPVLPDNGVRIFKGALLAERRRSRRHFMQNLRKVQNCSDALKSVLTHGFTPKIAFVLGTGLGDFASSLEDSLSVPYEDLPDMPRSTVQSHQGAFVVGRFCGIPVIVQQGRCHLYEGRTPGEVCMGVRVMASLGVCALIVTNAAGAINPQFNAGGLMAITDQINMTGKSPLTGPNEERWGVRFPDMSEVYDRRFLDIAAGQALRLGIGLEKGVYVCVPGPQLETRAETRAYRLLGGDAVGMSTALEVIAARHMGVRVLGLSCLTNKNLPDCMAETSIEEIIAAACDAADQMTRLLTAVTPEIAKDCV